MNRTHLTRGTPAHIVPPPMQRLAFASIFDGPVV